jgi:hypothetical protein
MQALGVLVDPCCDFGPLVFEFTGQRSIQLMVACLVVDEQGAQPLINATVWNDETGSSADRTLGREQ